MARDLAHDLANAGALGSLTVLADDASAELLRIAPDSAYARHLRERVQAVLAAKKQADADYMTALLGLAA